MELVIGLLTLVLVLTSLLLILLILIQLPKKEAGAGLAFGGGASDALFGAGSGTVLTRVTKYGAAVFLGLSLFLSVMRTHNAKAARSGILSEIERRAKAAAVTTPPTTTPTTIMLPALPPLSTGAAPALPVPAATNLPVNRATNAARPTPEAPGK